MSSTPPKLKRCQNRGKITTYPDQETTELFYVGKENGWDTPRIVREAVERALREHKDKLCHPAEQSAS